MLTCQFLEHNKVRYCTFKLYSTCFILNYFRAKDAAQRSRCQLVNVENGWSEVCPAVILVVVKKLWICGGPTGRRRPNVSHEVCGRRVAHRGGHHHGRPLQHWFDQRPLRVARSKREERGDKVGDQGTGECGRNTGWHFACTKNCFTQLASNLKSPCMYTTLLTLTAYYRLFAAAQGDSGDSQEEAKVKPAEERKSLMKCHFAQHLFPSVCR